MRIIAAILLMLSLAAPVAAGTTDDDAILSKSDARAMFAFSRPQWEANVAAVVTAGLGRATGSPATGIGVTLKTPDGAVQTLPVYVGSDAKPNKLLVTVEYSGFPAGVLSDAGVQASIAKAKQEMLPEYIVSGDFKRAAGEIAIFFTIWRRVS
ncbi:MAG: hypothetical protein WA592_26505 [Pseudolabrys sp.]